MRSKEFDSCFQVGSIEEIADALEKRSGSEENALAMLAMTAFTLMCHERCNSDPHPTPEIRSRG
ncbi:hypothetical protein [Salmonella enterica]|uniref:hypothetical protein n=1 Tax=Salmonella enterica TaxID=28901 RepID=UPI00391F27B7